MSSAARIEVVRGNPRMLAEVRAGLAAGGTPKTLPSKYLYDRRGSLLFEEITRLPEYYLTRAEREILERWMPRLVRHLRPRTLVELGAGSAEKTRVILDAMRASGSAELYVPLDVSAAFLEETARRLRGEYPGLHVSPCVCDITEQVRIPTQVPRPALFAFLGSTIGNFEEHEASRLLRDIRAEMRSSDRLLLGADLRKDVRRLEAAYNDAQGVTDEFSRNILHVLNNELGSDFAPDAFEHRAFYNAERHRMEIFLVAREPQLVNVPGIGEIAIAADEPIRTEISCKYDRASIAELFAGAGMSLEDWQTDAEGLFALALAAPTI